MQTLLFLHGWGGDENSFAPIIPTLKKLFNCITISMPMDTPKAPWKMEDYADMVFRDLKARNIERTHLVAHSFGARVAVTMLNQNPNIFDKMILTGAAGIPPRKNFFVWLRIRLYKLKRELFPRSKQKGSLDYRKLSPNGKITFQNIIKKDLRPYIANLTTPTLLIYGSRDTATPVYMAKRWTELAQNVKLRIYKEAGHFCYIDESSRFISDVLDFLKR